MAGMVVNALEILRSIYLLIESVCMYLSEYARRAWRACAAPRRSRLCTSGLSGPYDRCRAPPTPSPTRRDGCNMESPKSRTGDTDANICICSRIGACGCRLRESALSPACARPRPGTCTSICSWVTGIGARAPSPPASSRNCEWRGAEQSGRMMRRRGS